MRALAKLKIVSGTATLCQTVSEKTRLSDALLLAGIAPAMPCGGHGRCGKCRVVASGQLSDPSVEELACLSSDEMARGVRLACAAMVLGDAEVQITHREAAGQICVSGAAQSVVHAPMFSNLGAAVDVGSTTLAAALFDESGQVATAAALNPQRAFGADVINRIGRAMAGDGLALAQAVRQAIGELLEQMCAEVGRETAEIDGMVVTGNTTMLHLLTGEDPSPLAAAPFEARELFGKVIPAETLDLPCAPKAQVYLPRCVSAFVGADITTALLASGICRQPSSAMLIDIGTNGEIALWHEGRLTCCSTAAGPAFEGAKLSQGMQGTPGAIDRVRLEGHALMLHTIGDLPARGICGSGVADLLACLLQSDRLDETGCLADGADAVLLTEAVSFTQQDIRQVQLAKSAVRAGMETLLHHAGLTPDKLPQLAIAGGFGSYLSLDSAAVIGLIPEVLASRSQVLGNAALSGAAMILQSRGLQGACEALASSAKTVDLSTDPVFMDNYIEYMMFVQQGTV